MDTEKAAVESPFKSTIAHGYLTLSMLPYMWNQIIEVNESFEDLDFNNDGNTDAIHSYYMTPFLQFGAVEMLKNLPGVSYMIVNEAGASVYSASKLAAEEFPEIDKSTETIEHTKWL